MFEPYTESSSDGVWTLVGLDTFENEWYPLDGDFTSEAEARLAAATRLDYLDVTQPVESSGGQSGIQDQVWAVRPDGSKFRVW